MVSRRQALRAAQVDLDAGRIAKVRQQLAKGLGLSESVANADPTMVSAANLLELRKRARLGLEGAGNDIQPLLDDPSVTDVLINGYEGVWVDKGNGIVSVNVPMAEFSEVNVRRIAVRLAAACGQRLDDACPIADGTLPDGTRLNAVLPPLATNGALISLRTRKKQTFSLADLVRLKMVDSRLLPLMDALVNRKANVLVSGSTGAGKTTFLSAILGEVPSNERILCLEENVELAPSHPHVVHLTVRKPNVQNIGGVDISDLVRTAMRMRPDRLVLGECRGAEVRDVLAALNTGHEGGWATIHANSAMDVPVRLVALGALAKMPEATVAAQAAAAIDAIIHVTRTAKGRQLKHIAVLERSDTRLRAKAALALEGENKPIVYLEGWPQLAARLGLTEMDLR